MLRLTLAAIAVLFSTSAFAGVFLEPYVGYQSGDTTSELTLTAPSASSVSNDLKVKGVSFGARVGVIAFHMALGAEYLHGDVETQDNGDTTKYKEDNFGPFISIPLFASFRLNGTYFPSAKIKSDDKTEFEGTGYKLGLSMRLISVFHLSVDYLSTEYDEATVPGSTIGTFTGDKKTTLISLSVPLGD